MSPSHDPRFWIEQLAAPAAPRRLSGCDLCEHCTLLRLLTRERSQPIAPNDEQRS